MKKFKKLPYFILVFVIAAVMAAIITVLSLVTGNIIESTAINNISEIATHDRNTINMFVEYNWKNLQRIGARLKRNAGELNTIDGINKYLSYEANESTFDKVYLLMEGEEGSYYTDITYRQNAETPDFYPYGDLFTEGGSYKVIGYDSLPVMSDDKVVIYAYELRDSLSGIRLGAEGHEGVVRAVIGICKRSTITDGLIIESFKDEQGNVRGYSSVVGLDGDYVVDRKDTAHFDSDNLFRRIEESSSSELTKEQVKEKMEKGETFYFYHEHEGVREMDYCVPLSDNIGWYFIMSVSDAALAEQTQSLVLLIVAALGITIAVVITAIVVVIILQRKREQASAQERAQSEFLSNMSHEIRTPLNGLIGLNHLMITSIDDPEKADQMKEWLKKSQSTAKYLLSLINDVLDISKLHEGKIQIIHEPILVESVVDAIHSMQFDNLQRRGLEYITDINITVPCILGDEVHLKQVLMNIVSNAAKFTPSGGRVKLTVRQDMIDEKHVLTTFVCEDTGCGMSKEFLTRIFDKFSQDRNSVADSTKGTGLGMAISKLLAVAMGGDITVESEQGVGSTFTVTVPAEISEIPDYLKLEMKQEEVAEDAPAKPLNVLVAEDNELNAEILMEILDVEGFTAVHAENGEEAVKIFEQSKVGEFDVILMDMRMPVMDGCEATSAIRKLDKADAKTVPIFACTANSFEEDRIAAYNSGMNDFLTKPIDVKLFLKKLDQISKGKNIEIDAGKE